MTTRYSFFANRQENALCYLVASGGERAKCSIFLWRQQHRKAVPINPLLDRRRPKIVIRTKDTFCPFHGVHAHHTIDHFRILGIELACNWSLCGVSWPHAWNSLKNQLMTLHLLDLHPRMPIWRQTPRYLTGFVKRCLQKWSKQTNSAAVTKYKKPPTPALVPWSQSCQSATHCTLWVHSDWWSKANYQSGLA